MKGMTNEEINYSGNDYDYDDVYLFWHDFCHGAVSSKGKRAGN